MLLFSSLLRCEGLLLDSVHLSSLLDRAL
uniref:Uncharacterized protein n=1 Tax=Anguilla anguilla TaxID=7936 RepID=A0A0E9RW78_ANGAN